MAIGGQYYRSFKQFLHLRKTYLPTAPQSNDPRITLVAGGYPLFHSGKIAGGIGVGGGTAAQDCEIAEYVLSVFEKLTK